MPLELVDTFPVGPLACNCAIVADRASREAIVIDPGDEPDRVLKAVSDSGLKVVALLHTHAHIDHVGTSALVARLSGAPLLMHADDASLYAMLPQQAALFGLEMDAPAPLSRFLEDGELVKCGDSGLTVLHTPGHTPGSVCFRMEGDSPLLFSGDTLFRRSIGRTDLWGGSTPQILESIRKRLFALPGDLVVLPGHGEETTIAEEARLNPFVGARAVPLV